MKSIISYVLVIGTCYLSSTVEAVGQTVNKCVMNCRGDGSCTTRLFANEYAHPGDIRNGSCDKFKKCSNEYPVHCQKCSEFCETKQEKSGVYDTAVITLSASGNKKLENNKREKVTCSNLKSTRSKAVDRELISAAKDTNLLSCLLPKVNIEAKTNYGYTLLILSASVGNRENVETLLDKRANINAENDQGVNAFILAAEKGHLEVVKLLAKKEGRKLQIEKADVKGRTALIWAAMKGHLEVVKYLIEEKKANANAVDSDGQTPLLLASKNNHDDIVNYLTGVNGSGSRPVKPAPGRPSSGGNNDALIEEAFKGKTETVMALLKDDNKNYQDKNGRTVLIAAAEGGHEQLVSKLIKFGVDVRKETRNNQMTALHLEASSGHLQNVKDLLKRGADKNAKARYNFKRNYTPIILAAKEGHKAIVEVLIEKNANVEQETEDGYNAILWAAKERHRDVVKALLDYYQRAKSDGLANLFMDSFRDAQRLGSCTGK